MSTDRIKRVVEAALMVADGPLSLDRLQALFAPELGLQVEKDDLRAALDALREQYREHGVELREVASGWRFQARTELAPWVNRLWEERTPRYSRALLETLAIIAYRQPITRGEIEDIRGVAVSPNIVKTLLEREWVRVAGHRDVPGRPAVYVTTREFLDYFNLKSLSELPSLADLRDIDDINLDLFGEAAGDRVEPGDATPTDENGEPGAGADAEPANAPQASVEAADPDDSAGDAAGTAQDENADEVAPTDENGEPGAGVDAEAADAPQALVEAADPDDGAGDAAGTAQDDNAAEAMQDDTEDPMHVHPSAAAAK
jgi:segregation and condensation protein B